MPKKSNHKVLYLYRDSDGQLSVCSTRRLTLGDDGEWGSALNKDPKILEYVCEDYGPYLPRLKPGDGPLKIRVVET